MDGSSIYLTKIQKALVIEFALVLFLLVALAWQTKGDNREAGDGVLGEDGAVYEEESLGPGSALEAGNSMDMTEVVADGCIKWVDFDVSYDALCLAYEWDVKTYEEEIHFNWIELLAYLGTKYGGDFERYGKNLEKDMDALVQALGSGTSMAELTQGMKYYDYYLEAYGAVLDGMVGEYEMACEGENGAVVWEKKYGLKAYFPIAKGFTYTHYDDFGAGRSYGYDRKHLGHDMMGQTGTPIIAVESGIVEAIGWNQYGGWRVGVRSFDGKRYYYYAHLRQNYPYAEGLEEGSVVTAGDVIGYMGRTGYSAEENVNNIDTTHLHWGLELIFDEERREQGYEVWIDVYALTQFLYKNRCETAKVEGTKEWKRVWEMKDPMVTDWQKKSPGR